MSLCPHGFPSFPSCKACRKESRASDRAKVKAGLIAIDVPGPGRAVPATVKWWADSKGYGFLRVGDRDVYAHYTAIEMVGFKTLSEGQRVTCVVVDGPKGPQAAEIRPVPNKR